MKKIYLIVLALLCFSDTEAQYRLSGSNYIQDFNTLQAGMPEGWETDTNAKAGTPGGAAILMSTPSASTRWNNAGGGFKNVASANGFTSYSSANPGLQLAATDRALGIRQTGSFGDPGAAFTFRIDHTYGLSDFELDFSLQTLDSNSGRKTEWLIQYAIGDSPVVFTTVALYKTGGFMFENKRLMVRFGALLDNQAERVWVRVATLGASTGSGSRTTTAIDDVELRWKGLAIPGFRPLAQQLFPPNKATDVRPGTVLSIKFSRYINLGTAGSIQIKNETDNTLQTIYAGSAFLTNSGKNLLISGVWLEPGKTYHVTFDSTIADTAGVSTYALEDTAAWRFSTVPSVRPAGTELFDTGCTKGYALPEGWSTFSIGGAEVWNCDEHTTGNYAMRMYGNDGTANTDNEDWLISPLLDLSDPDATGIAFSLYKQYSGPELQVFVSDRYAGSGSPDSASWTTVPIPMPASDANRWVRYSFPAGSIWKGKAFRVGFRYSSAAGSAYDTRLDSFMIMVKTAIMDKRAGKGNMQVIDEGKGRVGLRFKNMTYSTYEAAIFNASGRCISRRRLAVTLPVQQFSFSDLELLPGLYVIRIYNNELQLVEKFIMK